MLDYIHLLPLSNVSSLPIEFNEELTIPRMIGAMENKINKMIDTINNMDSKSNDYCDKAIAVVNNTIEELKKSIEDGTFIKDGTIGLEKLKPEFLEDLNSIIIRQVRESCKMVNFLIDDSGHYAIDVPYTWDNINFKFENGYLSLYISDN